MIQIILQSTRSPDLNEFNLLSSELVLFYDPKSMHILKYLNKILYKTCLYIIVFLYIYHFYTIKG